MYTYKTLRKADEVFQKLGQDGYTESIDDRYKKSRTSAGEEEEELLLIEVQLELEV